VGVTSILNNYGIPRPLDTFNMSIIAGDLSQLYGADCASGISGQVQVIFSGPIAFVTAANAALTPVVSSDTLTYTIGDFGVPNDNTAFNSVFKVNGNAVAGTAICFTVSVTPLIGDFNPSNNTATYCFPVVASLDPNEKEVYPTSVDSGGQWLTYTVRFQNTGTAPAVNIIVADTLSPNLDASTFQLLTYSAPNLTQIFANVVNFNFPNINLPDSTTSDSLSRGYVQFRIKTISNLQPDAVISNTASIYFDSNPAVVTNTVTDTLSNAPVCIPDTSTLSLIICSGDTVYIGNQPYYTNGNYTDTLTNVGGCDSIVSLQLTISPADTLILPEALCTGDTVYMWGNAYDTTGNYIMTYTNVNGCDSLVILSVVVSPATYDTLSATICAGEIYLVGAGQIIHSQPGNYTDTITNSNGCDSIVSLSLTVNPVVYDTTSASICSGDTFYVGNIPHTLQGNYTDTLQSVAGCDSIVNLVLTVNPSPVATLSWDAMVAAHDFLGYYYDTIWCSENCPQVIALSGGSPSGGIYSGHAVSNNTFYGDSILTTTHVTDTIFYTYTDSNACSAGAFDTVSIEVCEDVTQINPNNAISLYPNPASSLLYIKTEGIQPQTITIYDVNGQAVLTHLFTPELDIHNLASGVYLLEINSVEGVARKRWVKM
jgi:uncharacterized repeat protein (TIGR01451 family)